MQRIWYLVFTERTLTHVQKQLDILKTDTSYVGDIIWMTTGFILVL